MNAIQKSVQNNRMNQNTQVEAEAKKKQEATRLERTQQASTHFELHHPALQVRPAYAD